MNALLLSLLLASPVPPVGGSGWQPVLQSAVVVEAEEMDAEAPGQELPAEMAAEAPAAPKAPTPTPDAKQEARPAVAPATLGQARVTGSR